MDKLEVSRSVAYEAIKRFSGHFRAEGSKLRWVDPDEGQSESEHT